MKDFMVTLWMVIGFVAVILGLTWAVQGSDFFMYKAFAPKYEEARRETFEQSRAYREGMAQELERMQFEYEQADRSMGKGAAAAQGDEVSRGAVPGAGLGGWVMWYSDESKRGVWPGGRQHIDDADTEARNNRGPFCESALAQTEYWCTRKPEHQGDHVCTDDHLVYARWAASARVEESQ